MAVVTFKYLGKSIADDPHIQIHVEINGAVRHKIIEQLSRLTSVSVDRDDIDTLSTVLLQLFCRAWRKANPSGTLTQLKTALEAASWEL